MDKKDNTAPSGGNTEHLNIQALVQTSHEVSDKQHKQPSYGQLIKTRKFKIVFFVWLSMKLEALSGPVIPPVIVSELFLIRPCRKPEVRGQAVDQQLCRNNGVYLTRFISLTEREHFPWCLRSNMKLFGPRPVNSLNRKVCGDMISKQTIIQDSYLDDYQIKYYDICTVADPGSVDLINHE